MISAVVGVLGTLSAPLLAQRMTARQKVQASASEERRRHFDERRVAYTLLNRASREFHTILKDALHRIRDGVYADQDRTEVENLRRVYRDRYAEVQMIVPDRILDASRAVNEVLADMDAAAKRLDRGCPREGETPESLLLALKEAEPRLSALTEIMREDLGIDN
jgi:hypothetical protein